jgi:ribosomal protein L6P/L9E
MSFKTQFKEKMKHFWIIRGLDYTKLSIIINKVRSFRIPNTYRHKGIYRMEDSYKVKATKKGAL